MQGEPALQIDDLAGRRLRHYELIQLAGRGGMGVVYRAVDTRLQRTVAIKVMDPGKIPLRGFQRRFQKEARSTSAINHPNVAHMYEVGQENGLWFIAMEFVEGEPLSQKLQAGRLDEQQIVQIALQVVYALRAAHAKGIIHRDIKPSNIVITPEGHVKVLDFGLARWQDPGGKDEELTVTITAPGVIVGSIPYMSPEQALGKEVDARSDLFSAGTLLYEMTTGALPFQGTTLTEVLSKLIQAEPEAIGRFTYAASPELERIIRKCLEKDRECRYQSAAELAVDLHNLKRDHDTGAIRRQPVLKQKMIDRRTVLAQAAGTAIVLASGFGAYRLWHKHLDGGGLGILAVLPILNLSKNPQLEYLSDGITDDLINSLSRLETLIVRPRSSVFRYKEAYRTNKLNLRAVGHDLRVKAILTGRMLLDNGALMISVELTDVINDRQVWGEQYRQTMSSIFLAQEQAARDIANNLHLRLSAQDRARLQSRTTESSEANHLYLKGRFFWNKRTAADLNKAIEFFKQAIEIDPQFARAYAGLADCYIFLGNVVRPREMFPRAKEAAKKSIEIDPSAAEPHATLGWVSLHYDWNWAEAEASFKEALRLNANYPTAHSMYARYLSVMGRSDEAIAEMKKAQELDPLGLGISTGIGLCYYLAREYDRAIEQHKKTLEMEPRFALAHFNLGGVYCQKGRYKEAIEAFQTGLRQSSDDAGATAELGYTYARAGQIEQAQSCLRSIEAMMSKRYVSPYFRALVHAGLGERNGAMELLEEAYNDRSLSMVFLKADPRWDVLRADARFQGLLARLALK